MASKIDLTSTIAAGTFAGAQLMIGVSFALQWRVLTGDELVAQFAGDWIHIATTTIPFALLQTVFIPLSLYQARKNQPVRKLWVIALGAWLVNCTITSFYHFPVVWASMHGGYTAQDITGVIDQWVLVHWLRVALGYAVFLFAVLATLRAHATAAAGPVRGAVSS
jgi:hypothetical protein